MRPDFARLEQRLGIPLGMTLTALVAKAYEVAPAAPSQAFQAAGLRLRWIEPDFVGTTAELRQPSTPLDVLPIVETGVDLQHFGFLMRRTGFPFFSTATDRRSIVNVVADDPPAEPFAKNLRALLGIAATTGLVGVTRDELRRHGCRPPEGRDGFEEASRQLLTIPGVRRVHDPSAFLDGRPLTFEYAEEPALPFDPSRRRAWVRCANDAISAAHDCAAHGHPREALEICDEAFAFLAEGRLVGDRGMDPESALHGALKADLLRRLHFVRLEALAGLGDPARNRDALIEAIDALAALPFVHRGYWIELLGSMRSLGVVDPQLAARIEAQARAAETESL